MSTTIDPRELRRLMSHWATGVAVITSRGETGPRGATTQSLVMRARSGTVRSITTTHRLDKVESLQAISRD